MDRLLEILNDIRPEIDFTAYSDFIEEHCLDSLDIVVLINDIEEAYCITVDANEIVPENFSNLGAMMDLIERLGGQI